MSSLTIAIIVAFVIGYFFIAIESVTKINKAAIALLMFVVCWTLFMIDPTGLVTSLAGVDHSEVAGKVGKIIEEHLGETGTTLFFLMGAMTIVELVDQNGGFNFVKDTLKTKSKRSLLAHSFHDIHPECNSRQSHHVHSDDYDIEEACQGEKGPHHLCLACHHCRQLWWSVLTNRRRYDHHAVEQGRDNGCWRDNRNSHTLAHIHGHPSLHTVSEP